MDQRFQITSDRALETLRAIDDGRVSLEVEARSFAETNYGNVRFIASNGWVFVIYLKERFWHYFDSITSPEGIKLTFEEIADAAEHGDKRLFTWEPTNYRPWEAPRIAF